MRFSSELGPTVKNPRSMKRTKQESDSDCPLSSPHSDKQISVINRSLVFFLLPLLSMGCTAYGPTIEMHPKEVLEGGSAEEGGCLGAQKMYGLSFVRRQKMRVDSVLVVQRKRNKDQENKDLVFSRSFFPAESGGKGARRESRANPCGTKLQKCLELADTPFCRVLRNLHICFS